MKSKMQRKDGRCYLCIKLYGDERMHSILHEHHVFGGPNRALSEAEGLKVLWSSFFVTLRAKKIETMKKSL